MILDLTICMSTRAIAAEGLQDRAGDEDRGEYVRVVDGELAIDALQEHVSAHM